MSKKTNINAPQRKLQGVKCHLGLPAVTEHEHQVPFGSSYYYQGFEFYPLEYVKTNSTQGRFEPDFQSYLAPYYGCPYEYPGVCLQDCPGDGSPCEHIFEESISNEMNPDRFLSQLCNGCKTAPVCDHDIKTSFTKKLVLGIRIQKRAFCPPSSSFLPSDCECSFCRKLYDADPLLREKIIHVHDLRFMGHPTEVDIHYHYSRCDYKMEGMQNLPGIYEGSGSNQVRFTCRLAKAINTALAENIRKTFISEACAVSVNTINHWLQRELRLHSKKHDEYSVTRKFSSNAVPQVSYDTFQIHSENHIFVFDQTGEKESLRAIYSEQEWNSMADLVSGTSWGSFDSSNVPRLLNLACDYLSCCTDVPPNIGAMILSDIYCWGEAGSIDEYSCLFRSMNQDAYGGYKRPLVRRRTAAVRCQRPECKPYLI